MMKKELGLVFLPAIAGLPGSEERHLETLAKEIPALEWKNCRDKDEFARLLPDAAAALVWSFSSELNGSAGKLRLLSTPSAGRELVRAEKRPDLKIVFGSFHGELMAETLAGMMLASVRGIRHSFAPMRAGEWPRREVGDAMRPLRGSHAVILGFGHIGKWCGRLLKPFGVRLTGVNRSSLDRPDYFGESDRVAPFADLDALLPTADHLALVLPGDTGTDGLIDGRRLALLPGHAHVYNIGRGNALDMDALCDALESGAIAGAGLDVFPEEPLPAEARIRRCPNVVLTPHVSSFAPNYLDLYVNELLPHLKGIFNRGGAEE